MCCAAIVSDLLERRGHCFLVTQCLEGERGAIFGNPAALATDLLLLPCPGNPAGLSLDAFCLQEERLLALVEATQQRVEVEEALVSEGRGGAGVFSSRPALCKHIGIRF